MLLSGLEFIMRLVDLMGLRSCLHSQLCWDETIAWPGQPGKIVLCNRDLGCTVLVFPIDY